MIAHVILFKPRLDLTATERTAFADALAAAWRQIPSVRRFHVGRRVRHGRAYEHAMVEDYAFAAIVEFETLAGLQQYLDHPAHDHVGRLFGVASAAALAYDYEMVEPSGLAALFQKLA